MNYKCFEDLPVWNAAIELSARIFRMTGTGMFSGYSGLKDQIERAVVSISNNIAEGFERGTHEELLSFLYYARGSAAEVRSMLKLIERLPSEDMSRPYTSELIPLALSVSRQLGAWIESLKNSDNRGHRYQNDATRKAAADARRRGEFLEKLERIKNQAHKPPDPSPEDS